MDLVRTFRIVRPFRLVGSKSVVTTLPPERAAFEAQRLQDIQTRVQAELQRLGQRGRRQAKSCRRCCAESLLDSRTLRQQGWQGKRSFGWLCPACVCQEKCR